MTNSSQRTEELAMLSPGEFAVFQFDVTCEYFKKALDIFAQC